MLKTPALIGLGLIATLGLIDARPGKAVCLSSGDAGANDCFTFDGTTTTAKQTYTTSNLTSNGFFQLGFYSSNNISYNLSNVEYSQDDSTYFSLGSITTGTGGFASPNYFPVNSFSPGAVNVPFYIRYTIGGPVAAGTTITSKLLSNNNGFTDGGPILLDNGNNYVSVSRSSTAVPAPLPILGAAAAFARVKRFRRNSKLLSHMG